MTDTGQKFTTLVDIIARLRDPEGGCPWDLKQTHETLKQYLIEEAYELLDAIDNQNSKISEELGDVLLQVLLHSQIAKDEKHFSIDDVIQILTTKLIERHPHVFSNTSAETAEEVEAKWEQIKQKKERKGVLSGLPQELPALLRAQRIGDRVARVGFDWANIQGVKEKLKEELHEVLEIDEENTQARPKLEEELGDLLFTLTQLIRRWDFNAEELLRKGCDKFTRRFEALEEKAGAKLSEHNKETLQKYWKEVKAEE